jgi:hypothetical protein
LVAIIEDRDEDVMKIYSRWERRKFRDANLVGKSRSCSKEKVHSESINPLVAELPQRFAIEGLTDWHFNTEIDLETESIAVKVDLPDRHFKLFPRIAVEHSNLSKWHPHALGQP